MSHQYSATSLHGHSSAHFGDVYIQQHNDNPTRGQTLTPVRPSSLIPFRRDRAFVERDVLDDVCRRALEPAARIGLVGLGGVGKTQIVIEYAYRRRDTNPQMWVFWVHASSAARFEESYRQIAQQAQISNWADPRADVLSMVYTWLSAESNGQWTMVVDNADSSEIIFGSRSGNARLSNERSLADYLPTAAHGSIVITSRSREVVDGLIEYAEDILGVHPMTEEDGILLLTSKLKKMQRGINRIEVGRLVQELDYMPLAITQAAAYINQLSPWITVAQYLEKLAQSELDRDRLLAKAIRDPRRDGQASNSILTTWHTSFEHIRRTRSSAARLLGLMSLFDREGIPESLLRGQYFSPEEEQPDQTDEVRHVDNVDDFEDDVRMLSAYSLISTGTDELLFDMHRLVQFSTKKWLELHHKLAHWQEQYVTILEAAFPTGDYVNWSTCQALFPHVELVLSYRGACHNHRQECATTLYRAAWYAWQSGRYEIARQMAVASFEDWERLLGGSSVQAIHSLYMLAVVLRRQGKYTEAEEIGRQALAGCEKELGANHPNTLASLSILAQVLNSRGKYTEAEERGRQALVGCEKELGANHPNTLASLNTLAVVLRAQGRYAEAEEIGRRVLAGCEKELGANHPNTLTSLSNLTAVLESQGKYIEAEEIGRQALVGCEKELGANHPNTLKSLINLAVVLRY